MTCTGTVVYILGASYLKILIRGDFMKKEYSFVIGEGKDLLSCLNELGMQKSRIIRSRENEEFIGKPQFFKPDKNGEMWYAYQQYTYECEGKSAISDTDEHKKAEDVVIGTGKNFFLCCCDLNNRIRLKRCVIRNVKIIGVPQFQKPTAGEKLWKAVQKYTYNPHD